MSDLGLKVRKSSERCSDTMERKADAWAWLNTQRTQMLWVSTEECMCACSVAQSCPTLCNQKVQLVYCMGKRGKGWEGWDRAGRAFDKHLPWGHSLCTKLLPTLCPHTLENLRSSSWDSRSGHPVNMSTPCLWQKVQSIEFYTFIKDSLWLTKQ